MPVLDELEATRRYRASGGSLPTVAMTAYAVAGRPRTVPCRWHELVHGQAAPSASALTAALEAHAARQQ